MKSNVRIKSWKRTISLAALLFIVFALTVLSWAVMSYSKLSFVSSPASPVGGRITYSAVTNVMTVSGAGTVGFWDLWNASNVNGWNVVWNNRDNNSQYQFDCRIQVGDAVTATILTDTNKQIVFSNMVTGNELIKLKNKSNITLGTLIDPIDRTTKNGCTIYNSGSPTYFIDSDSVTSSGAFNLYGCQLYSTGFLAIRRATSTLTDDIFNCLFVEVGFQSALHLNCYNIAIYSAGAGSIRVFNSVAGTFNDVVMAAPYSIYQYYNSTIYNSIFRDNSVGLMRCPHVAAEPYGWLVNVISDNWKFIFDATYTGAIYRQYTIDLKVVASNETAISNANVTFWNGNGTLITSVLTNSSGQIAVQRLTSGFYNQTGGNTIYSSNPYNLTITASGYQTYMQNFTLSQKTDWTIAMQPLTDGGMIEHVKLVPVDPDLTSPSSTYRWLDVADQAYGIGYQNSYNYSQVTVEVAYCKAGNTLSGILTARNLKPNFAYQLKLVGTPGTADNERIGLAGRWWQEEWTGSYWANGQNLNNKGNGSSPNPNDQIYLSRRYIEDSGSPTGYHYRYTGYLVFDYFITDSNGSATLQFETGSCYHVLWKTSQRSNVANDGPVKRVTFDPDPSQPAYDTDYPSNTVSIFGEWERLPMGDVNLQPGEYNCQIILTEESFHGSGGSLAGNWAGTVSAYITFTTS